MDVVAEDRGFAPRLRAWWERRRALRADATRAAEDLFERYGMAAHGIALRSSHHALGPEQRVVWARAARRLKRRRDAA